MLSVLYIMILLINEIPNIIFKTDRLNIDMLTNLNLSSTLQLFTLLLAVVQAIDAIKEFNTISDFKEGSFHSNYH